MRRAALAAAGAAACGLLPAAEAAALTASGTDRIPLMTPVRNVDPLASATAFGLRRDRLLTSVVPGPVSSVEQVTVALGTSGAPSAVVDRQQLVISRAGNYIVRELGPARQAEGLGDTVPPVLELGQVVWQGFSPGTRTLRAKLTLDPDIEARRLPMTVSVGFRDRSGRLRALGAGAVAPVDGTATVTLHNATGSQRTLATGTAQLRPLAAALDRLYAAAGEPRAAVPPYAGAGLPRALAGTRGATETVTVVAPLRVTGTLGAAQATTDTVRGPGTTPAPNGAHLAGTLDADASFKVGLRAGQHLVADLDVRPWLDPRLLAPRSSSWRAWAATSPSASQVAAATSTLALGAAAAARAAEYAPYLQADTPGPDVSSFRYVMARAVAAPRAGAPLRAKPAALAVTVLAAAVIAGNAALLWRRL